MEDIATGLAVEAVKAITNVVLSKAGKEIKLIWGFMNEIQKLKKRFSYIQGMMNDLGKGKHAEKSQLVEFWLQDVKDVAYSAENLLDDYAYEMLRRKIELKTNRPSFKKKCGNCMTPSTCPLVFRLRMTCRVKQILSELDELEKRANNHIGLQQVQLARDAISASTSVGRHTDHTDSLYQARKHAAARGSGFIGREDDKKKLLQTLLKNDGLSIIAIVGIGGLGKTTLARHLYEREEVNAQFSNKKFWICVSEDFDVDKILKEMVEKLTSAKCDLSNTDAIIKKLDEALMGKKFLLVLDDVWNDNKELWDSLKTELQGIGGLIGSVILITTRSIGVARKACASYLHKLEGLSEEDGWVLLKQQVFDDTMPYDSSFDDVGKRIVVEKCKGVPLAIKSIGGLLQSKQQRYEWESIESNELWDIKAGDNVDIMPSLLLSYNHINDVYVKQCFAYCAIFPKDSVMKKGQLISLWLAQGFIYDEIEGRNLSTTKETIGEKYFNVLVNHSFLEEENDDSETGYKMHDLVHDLAAYVSKKDLLVWNAGDKLVDDGFQLRHLVFNFGKNEMVPETLTKENMKKLRTISFWHGMPSWNSLICAKYIRTLVMAEIGLSEVPSILGQLVQLRYLDLSENKIESLPESICKLYQLQTLRLFNCFSLRELPKKLHKLENLRHIDTSNEFDDMGLVFAPRGLRQLTSLQTLPRLELREEEGWTIDELEPLNQLKGHVCIKGLEHVKKKEEATKACLGMKDKISNLELSWDSDREGDNDEDILDGLEPHPNIELLRIKGFRGEKFPRWTRTMSVKQIRHQIRHTSSLSHLIGVFLMDCRRCRQVPSLGQLPKLRILRLEGFDEVPYIGDEFYENGSNTSDRKASFPALRELYIENFESLTSWMSPSWAVFPNLETLEILYCGQLEMVPASQLKSLKNLFLKDLSGNQPLDIIKGSYGFSSLKVWDMEEMVRLPEEVSNCRNLQTLDIGYCDMLKWMPSGIISLRKMKVDNCPSLESVEDGVFQGLSSLRQLTIVDCTGLKRIAATLEDCTSLEELYMMDCPLIKEDPVPDFGKLRGLTKLTLVNVGRLTASSPQWIRHLHRLYYLDIGGCEQEWDMSLTSTLSSLRVLRLNNFPDFKGLEPLPQQPLQHLLPPFLQSLHIHHFEHMERLPHWIAHLSSLQSLTLLECNRLKYLPSTEAMAGGSRLPTFTIIRCPLLEQS